MHESTPSQTSTAQGESRKLLPTTLLLAALLALSFQGSRGLYESTEGRYARCAQETLQSGSLLEPMLNGEHHWSKPPLAYLPIAAGIHLFGNNAWGARGFQGILFLLAVLAVYAAGRELWNPGTGALAALVYATSPFIIGAANTVSTDNLLVLFEAVAVACYWRAVRHRDQRYMVLAWTALAFAFLTKGPVALFPLLGILPAHYHLRRVGANPPRLASLPGLTAFFTIGLSWYVLEILRHPDLLDRWLVHETLDRFATDEYRRNAEFHKAFTIYSPILLFGTGPWAILLAWKRNALGITKGTFTNWRAWCPTPEATYLLTAIFIPLLLLMISQSRLPLYALALFPPIALALGRGLARTIANHTFAERTVLIIAITLSAILLPIKGASAWYPSRRDMGQLAQNLRPVLAEYPQASMLLLYNEPLNGLEYYLNRPIPMHPLPTADSPEEGENRGPIEAGTLVLARTKHLRSFSMFLPDGALNKVYQDRNWTLVQVKQTIDIQKQFDALHAAAADTEKTAWRE